MKPEGKISIISKLRQTRKEPVIVGHGLETKHGEHVTSFRVESRELASYVEKPLKNEKTAKETFEMYKQLSLLGLPVVSFLKIIKSKEVDTGQNQYTAAMEDLSAYGQNLVLKIGDITKDPDNIGNKLGSHELLAKAKSAEELVDQMARALAVLHNNGIYEFHNQISFFIIVNRSKLDEKSERPTLDFKILDYSNFTNAGSENSLTQDALSDNVPGFEHGIEYNLKNLKSGVGNLADKLEEKYKKYRQEKLMAYASSVK